MKIFVFILCFVFLDGMNMRVTSHRTAKKCVLPKSQKINWNKIRGNWYEALNRKSPLEKLLSCEAWSHVVSIKNGIKLNLRNEDWKTHTYSVLPMFIRITKSGTGIWKPPTVKKWFASLKQSSASQYWKKAHHGIEIDAKSRIRIFYRLQNLLHRHVMWTERREIRMGAHATSLSHC
ncbi:uncharacterized protein LOC120332739 isoform X3 [Styela clava]